MKRFGLVAVALAAGVALAANNITVEQVYQVMFRPWTRTSAQLPNSAVYTGWVAYNSTKTALTVSDGTDWRTASPMVGAITYDFPALGSGVLNTTCAESTTLTVAGALLGDGCFSSSNLGQDGGAALSLEATLTCRITAADTAKIRMCVSFTDAGAYDLADAGFYARAFH